MTDSHNSGQHKDREAAAAEVRRMWQPTPSWTQPDPNQDADPEAAETAGKPEISERKPCTSYITWSAPCVWAAGCSGWRPAKPGVAAAASSARGLCFIVQEPRG